MRTVTESLVRLCRSVCESPRAWVHFPKICVVVAEGRFSAHGLEMSNPELPGGLPAVRCLARLLREAVLPSAQVGTALGLAVLLTLAATRTAALSDGTEESAAEALVAGHRLAFLVAAGVASPGVVAAQYFFRQGKKPHL